MSELYPALGEDTLGGVPEAIDGVQQNQFIDGVQAKIVSDSQLRVVDPSALVAERNGRFGGDALHVQVAESRSSTYQPTEATRVTCKATPSEVSLEVVTRGAPVRGHPGLFFAITETYAVGQEAAEQEGQMATRYSDHVLASSCINSTFERTKVPEGVALPGPVISDETLSDYATDPFAYEVHEMGTGLAGDTIFTPGHLKEVEDILGTLSPDNLVVEQ